jgi:flagellar motor protein MotB
MGRGELEPVDTNDTEEDRQEDRQENRRVEAAICASDDMQAEMLRRQRGA